MEETESIGNELLKIDRRGHVRAPRARREVLLDEYEQCGSSAAELAAYIGVKYSTFCHWKRRRDMDRLRQRSEGEAASVETSKSVWLETVADPQVIAMEEASGNRPSVDLPVRVLPVTLPGGARLDITHRSLLPLAAGLLEMLRKEGGTSC